MGTLVDTESKQHAPAHIGRRRKVCWWEPIYEPDLKLSSHPYDWDIERDSGPYRRFISGSNLRTKVTPGDTFKITNATFKECDFQGTFAPDVLIMFDRCNFISCDFAFSNWKDTHFRACSFQESSISLSSFERCEFRDCKWENIGFGSKTEFVRTFINNPGELIGASISNRNPSNSSQEHKYYQWYRLKGTRAHLLRTIVISHESIGDEHTYYDTVKLHELQRTTARMSRDCYAIIFSKLTEKLRSLVSLIFCLFDYLILRSFGTLNGWGASASRPFFALATCFAFFGSIYKWATFQEAIARPYQKSFDITFLVGYGNQAQTGDLALTIVQDLHALISLVIYSVFFATVISKLSRAR